MSEIHINTEEGRHAAAGSTDADLRYLCSMILWELALRSDREEYEAFLRWAMEQREASEPQLERARHERDLMQFAAQVMLDIQQLPEVEQEVDEPGTGLYL